HPAQLRKHLLYEQLAFFLRVAKGEEMKTRIWWSPGNAIAGISLLQLDSKAVVNHGTKSMAHNITSVYIARF
ncbi:MAG: hypothetical protein AAGU11_13340, partial [Syntrophobacteraceae bacterium]